MAMRKSAEDRLFDYVNYTVLTLVLISVLYPLYFIVIASVSEPSEIYNGRVWFAPSGFLLEGYQRIFDDDSLWTGYRNSLIYTIIGTSINLLFTLPAAFALSRRELFARNKIMLFITFTMFFSGGLIPTYLLIRILGIVNTLWAMVLPNAVGVYNLIVARTFFQNIPEELADAARIDGASDHVFFTRIVLPVSTALVAIMVLFYGVNHWNSYFQALIYLKDEVRFPLQLVLRTILIENQASAEMMDDLIALQEQQRAADLIKYGMIILASAPLLVLYPFLQKYFVKGVMIGAIKG